MGTGASRNGARMTGATGRGSRSRQFRKGARRTAGRTRRMGSADGGRPILRWGTCRDGRMGVRRGLKSVRLARSQALRGRFGGLGERRRLLEQGRHRFHGHTATVLLSRSSRTCTIKSAFDWRWWRSIVRHGGCEKHDHVSFLLVLSVATRLPMRQGRYTSSSTHCITRFRYFLYSSSNSTLYSLSRTGL